MKIKILIQNPNFLLYFRKSFYPWKDCLIFYGVSNCHENNIYTIQRTIYIINWEKNKYFGRVFKSWEDE